MMMLEALDSDLGSGGDMGRDVESISLFATSSISTPDS